MKVEILDRTRRVIILDISGIYTQIYDELYCTAEKYESLLENFVDSDRYRIVVV